MGPKESVLARGGLCTSSETLIWDHFPGCTLRIHAAPMHTQKTFQLPACRKLVDLDALIRRVILLYAQATIQRASGAYTLRASSESGAVEITTSIVVIDGCEWRADTSRPIARRDTAYAQAFSARRILHRKRKAKAGMRVYAWR